MSSEYEFVFSPEKNARLKTERNISFEEIIAYIEDKQIIESVDHPDQDKYPGQKMYLVDVEGYVFVVPYERKGREVILKTIYPSRKATKQYKKEEK